MPPICIYIHFPWCLRKCPYCDFVSFERSREAIDHAGYADAVVTEIEARRSAFAGRRLETVFFGGGTPSLWRPDELGRVLEAVLTAAEERAPEVEITVACNPSSLDEATARALRQVGVNRLSVGVQGLDEERLRFLGRLHDGAGGLAAVRAALSAGVRVNADLLVGVATSFTERDHQSPEQALEEALAVAATGVGHLSAYQLTIEPRTRFGELARAGRLPMVDEQRMAATYLAVGEALELRGFEHYEISNFALPGQRSRHNLGYWLGWDYLGLGCAAYGTLSDGAGAVRYRNPPNPDRYLAAAAARDFRPHEREELGGDTRLRERIMLGLRLAEGLDIEAAAAELGVDPWPEERRRTADDLIARGRLERDGGRIRVPRRAWIFADGIAAALF